MEVGVLARSVLIRHAGGSEVRPQERLARFVRLLPQAVTMLGMSQPRAELLCEGVGQRLAGLSTVFRIGSCDDDGRPVRVVEVERLGIQAEGLALAEPGGDDRRVQHGPISAADTAETRSVLRGIDQGRKLIGRQLPATTATVLLLVPP
ncbi:MAG: hypothetical protein AAF108_09715 [Planctomycetota bacterium]